MAKLRSEAIVLIGNPERKEDVAVAAFSPGHLLEFSGAGVRKRATAAIKTRMAIAVENELRGGTINDAYAVNDRAYYVIPKAGESCQVRLAAAATAIVKGDFLEPAADGTFRKLAAGVAQAVALEPINNSAGGTEVFINVEFL